MKIGLVFTNDWELFGDGSGSIQELQIDPLNNFLETAEKYNAKITLMAEVMQQFAYQEKGLTDEKFLQDSINWENAIKKTIVCGSDVQLHIHSQWYNAVYLSENWELNYNNWAIGKIPKSIAEELILRGKTYLESIIKEVNPEYECLAFRAGAYCIQPSKDIIDILLRTGFKLDTSVTKGMKTEYFDFSKAYSNYLPWNVSSDDIIAKGSSNLVEIPIYSATGIDSPIFKKFLPKLYYKLKYGVVPSAEEFEWINYRDSVKNQRYPKKNRYYKKYQNKNLSFYISALLNTHPIQLDYDYIPASVFVAILKKIIKKYSRIIGNQTLPVIASGHFKDVPNCENINLILKLIKEQMPEQVKYLTLSEAYNYSQLTY